MTNNLLLFPSHFRCDVSSANFQFPQLVIEFFLDEHFVLFIQMVVLTPRKKTWSSGEKFSKKSFVYRATRIYCHLATTPPHFIIRLRELQSEITCFGGGGALHCVSTACPCVEESVTAKFFLQSPTTQVCLWFQNYLLALIQSIQSVCHPLACNLIIHC